MFASLQPRAILDETQHTHGQRMAAKHRVTPADIRGQHRGTGGGARAYLRCRCRTARARETGSPVSGLINNGRFEADRKLNRDRIEPASASAAPLPSIGSPQLYSMNFTTQLWSMTVL